jgi:hypothetical protein
MHFAAMSGNIVLFLNILSFKASIEAADVGLDLIMQSLSDFLGVFCSIIGVQFILPPKPESSK